MKARALLAVLAVLLAASPAMAEEQLSWLGARLPNGPGVPWPYKLDARKATPAGIPLETVESVFEGAFQQWQDVSCSFIEMRYDGRDSAAGARQPDRLNVMGVFLESRAEDEEIYDLALGSGMAVAVALPLYYGGTIYECDIALNATDYRWATDGSVIAFDLQTVANHETGHCLGLDHWGYDSHSVMNSHLMPGELRHGLTAHDVDNVCRLYPQTGAVGSPCPEGECAAGLTCSGSGATAFCTQGCEPETVGSCPIGFSCVASSVVSGSPGSCRFGGEGSTRVGAPCTQPSDCSSASDALCIPYDSIIDKWEAGYCTAACSDTRECPANSTCYTMPEGEQRCVKTCRPGSGDCRFGYACEPTSDGSGRCLPACRADWECGGGVCDACSGLCVHPGAPGAQVGDSCASDDQCPAGGTCRTDLLGGTCVLSCASRCSTCPQGSACGTLPGTGEQLCFRSCSSPSDCPAGLGCWQDTPMGACMPPCESQDDCPVGQRCVAGSCLGPSGADGGCALCSDRDGGALEPLPDASVDSEPMQGGCGCASSGQAAGLASAALLLLGLLRRPGKQRR